MPCRYGDASDTDTLLDLQLDKVKMVVSTVHDYETNALILQSINKFSNSIVSILSAHNVSSAESLYDLGANYVIVPHVIGGHHTAMLIEKYEYDVEKYATQKLNEYSLLG